MQVMGDAHESAMENISLVSWGLNWLMDETLCAWERAGRVLVRARGRRTEKRGAEAGKEHTKIDALGYAVCI